ncbi:hypothetical protein D1AOALGA4SA_9503 [Olavius algarvensis Delta 1 endosymbiont]|nr:hypothetical protein D1AOALGA4SA_9503 [Olavius algarvensis Delta 1 endosymbiont]
MSKFAIIIATALILALFVPAASQAVLINLDVISDFEDISGPDKFTIRNNSSPGGTGGALIVEVVIDTRNSAGNVVFDTKGPYLDGFSGPAEDPNNPNLTGFQGFTFGDFIPGSSRYAQTITLDFQYAESNVFNSGETFTFWTDTDADNGADGYVSDSEIAGAELFVTLRGNSAADNFAPTTIQGDYGSSAHAKGAIPTPEPGTLLLLGSALMGMGVLGRKKVKGTKR